MQIAEIHILLVRSAKKVEKEKKRYLYSIIEFSLWSENMIWKMKKQIKSMSEKSRRRKN